MKVLAVSIPGVGHLLPMMPLLEAMIAQGDEVTLAADVSVRTHSEPLGLRHVPAGHSEGDWFEKLTDRTKGQPGDGLAPSRIDHYFVPRIFAEIGADDMIEDVLKVAEDWSPDVIVFESYAFAAPLVAALRGVPAVQHLIGPKLEADVLELANDSVSPLWRHYGLDVPGFAGLYEGTTIEICPPSFDDGHVPRGSALRLRSTPRPAVPSSGKGRPLVYVTLGTFMTNNDVFQTVLDGLADVNVEVLVTVGSQGDPAALGRVPPNATVERFIPQATLLPNCAAVVHHAGAGTMFGSLAHGLPQVLIPQGADNFRNAEMVERAGAGLTLLPGSVTPASVRVAVLEVLEREPYVDAARAIAAELESMPGPQEVAASLRSTIIG